jgi:hypothetical protein
MDDADLCISIEARSSSSYTVETDVSNTNGTIAVSCSILIDDLLLQDLNRCEGNFNYYDDGIQQMKFYLFVDNEYRTIETRYDFDDEEFIDGNVNNGGSNSDGDLDDFDLSASPSLPDEDESIDITIEALDRYNDTIEDYRGTVDFAVEYRSSSSSSRRSASSSLYDLDMDDYEFASSDDGEVILRDLLRLRDDRYDYRLVVEDRDENVDAYLYFCLENNNCDDDNDDNNDNDLEEFDIRANPDDPEEGESINITIEALDEDGDTIDSYDNTVRFYVEYRINSSSNWTTPSSTLYDLDMSSYEFRSSDDGEVTLRDLVKFDNDNYDYRLMVEDQSENVRDYIYFCFDSSSCHSGNNGALDEFEVTAYPSDPREDESVDLYIEALDRYNDTVEDYRGTVDFEIEYRSSSSSSRRSASSSLYDLDMDDYEFRSSDDGQARISNLVRFLYDEYDYRLRVEDRDENVEGYVYFCFRDNDCEDDDEDDIDDFDLSASPSLPDEDESIDITIEALDRYNDTIEDYRGTVDFAVEYRSSSSSSRRSASSSLYDLDMDDYEFASSDDGEVILRDLLRLRDDRYDYRLVVEDRDENVDAYLYFCLENNNCDDDDDNDDFSSREISTIEAIYNVWNSVIDELEDSYIALRNDDQRQDDQEELYEEMDNIIDGRNSIYEDYDDFYDGFVQWYSYTLGVIN